MVSNQLPKYKSHKEVKASKIISIKMPKPDAAILVLECGVEIDVDMDFIARHRINIGGYYVVYQDNNTTYSPKETFESGYTPTSYLGKK